ncbi:hypothetical protein EVAR_55917_1 [Eumeta japonica]|uniref:Uncharacterized protein n=1 Tax=Eumeta variegata TaxID=151549 RepID=A0A4C1YZQ8_EUMVA|nr:hypothetical protein EVAR_55917_1 [Eumeta japonica]
MDFLMKRNRLNTLQRGFTQKICKSYRMIFLNAVLVVSSLLPLDLRVHEFAALYKHKKRLSNDYLELGTRMSYLEQHHPSTLQRVTYEPLEDSD